MTTWARAGAPSVTRLANPAIQPAIQKAAWRMRHADETGANACVVINSIALLLR
jgi:hypothetical protein